MTDDELQELRAQAMQPCPRCGHVQHITAANKIVCSDPWCELKTEVDRWRALAIERHHNLETVAEANQQLTAEIARLRARVLALSTPEVSLSTRTPDGGISSVLGTTPLIVRNPADDVVFYRYYFDLRALGVEAMAQVIVAFPG